MWKDLFDLVRRSLRLAEDTHQTRVDVKVLQKEMRDLTAKSERETLQTRHAQALAVQSLQAQLERQNDESSVCAKPYIKRKNVKQ